MLSAKEQRERANKALNLLLSQDAPLPLIEFSIARICNLEAENKRLREMLGEASDCLHELMDGDEAIVYETGNQAWRGISERIEKMLQSIGGDWALKNFDRMKEKVEQEEARARVLVNMSAQQNHEDGDEETDAETERRLEELKTARDKG